MSEELKACPHCGTTDRLRINGDHRVVCRCQETFYRTEAEAIAAWSRRAQTPADELAEVTSLIIDAPIEEAAKLEDRGKSALSAFRASRAPAKGVA